MKRVLLSLLSLAAVVAVNAQCSELFFSEYIHGYSNNRAMEIYNPTSSPVDLSEYRIIRWSNGNDILDMEYVVYLTGTIAPRDVIVLVSDKRDPMGTGLDEPIHGFLEAKGDTFLSPVYDDNKCFFFNGNDAMSLEKNMAGGWMVVDIFGEIGVDPGDGWTDDASANYTDANGGEWWTRRRTLTRKWGIMEGVTTNPSPFNATIEWNAMGRSAWADSTYSDSLGFHNCKCENFVTSVNTIDTDVQLNVFPNPVTNNEVIISGEETISAVSIVSLIGQEVYAETMTGLNNTEVINTEGLYTGTYIVLVDFSNGAQSARRILVE